MKKVFNLMKRGAKWYFKQYSICYGTWYYGYTYRF